MIKICNSTTPSAERTQCCSREQHSRYTPTWDVTGEDGLHRKVGQIAFGHEKTFARPLGVAVAISATPNLLG